MKFGDHSISWVAGNGKLEEVIKDTLIAAYLQMHGQV